MVASDVLHIYWTCAYDMHATVSIRDFGLRCMHCDKRYKRMAEKLHILDFECAVLLSMHCKSQQAAGWNACAYCDTWDKVERCICLVLVPSLLYKMITRQKRLLDYEKAYMYAVVIVAILYRCMHLYV